ncbi:hypothetical protein VTN77DRAFT_792 [Rasamsonia byssochlamydoides]|uniref:uncharacterized protein n=1 Tax=Rasamsonia byssochlamydoides TaxID=89139 RepID=UPI003743DB68
MCTISSIASEHYGWGRHVWDVPPSWLPTTWKLTMSFQVTFTVASLFTKLSLLWFCRRILGTGIKGPFRTFNYCLVAAMTAVALLATIFIFLSIFQCIPVRAYWDVDPTYPYHCLDGTADVFAASVVNISTDFLTTVVPMPLIWRLKLPVRQRIAVIAIFGLGVTVNVAGSVRTYYVWKDMIDSYHDQTWHAWLIAFAASLEINLGIVCFITLENGKYICMRIWTPRLIKGSLQNRSVLLLPLSGH